MAFDGSDKRANFGIFYRQGASVYALHAKNAGIATTSRGEEAVRAAPSIDIDQRIVKDRLLEKHGNPLMTLLVHYKSKALHVCSHLMFLV